MLFLRYLLWLVSRSLLWLRYRLDVRGWEAVRAARGPVLLLPNHPGYIDPPIVLTTFWPRLRPRPMLAESMFQSPILSVVMRLLNALRVPDLDRPSAEASRRAEEAIRGAIDALRRGENVVLWPAGRVYRDGRENLRGARALTDLLLGAPEATVLLVRTRGVWGSRLSYAYTGSAPSMGGALLAGLGWLLAGLLLFAPRRRITLSVEKLERSTLPSDGDRAALNRWFEEWYNQGKTEQPTFVPYHLFLGPRTHDYPEPGAAAVLDPSSIRPEVRAAVNHLVRQRLQRPLTEAEDRADTQLDAVGIDSLARMDLALDVEKQFGFTGQAVPEKLGDLWYLAQGLAGAEGTLTVPPTWALPPSSAEPPRIVGDTVGEALVHRALSCRRDVCAADDSSGAITYERLLVGGLVMAARFARLPGKNVGLMLPAAVGCDVALTGLYLAGKVPIVLNWTTGPANLDHAARLMGLTHVITSKLFIDRTRIAVGGVEYVYLEELRQGIGKGELLRALVRVRWFPGGVRSRVPRPSLEDPAVVLFTSGSERAPKAVPLTHANLLANQRAALSVLDLTRRDSLLGFLPAFHSFGLSITGLLPLLSGLRVVRHADPTNAAALARKVAGYRPTVLVATPTFLASILDRARPGEMASLRIVIVGAEKCPSALFDRLREAAVGAVLLEGYGITECAPVVSVNRPTANRPGTIGAPLPGVELCVTDLETGEPVAAGITGMLLVSGPSVFPGYVGHDGPAPFRDLDGKKWYVTGDLASKSDDGVVTFAGRLKRFLKAGGEMISLPALEEPFARKYPPTEDGPRVAVEGIEVDGGRRVVLFTTEPLDLHAANDLLRGEGFHGVMRLDEVRRVDRIPVLGTGKTDYKDLRARIAVG